MQKKKGESSGHELVSLSQIPIFGSNSQKGRDKESTLGPSQKKKSATAKRKRDNGERKEECISSDSDTDVSTSDSQSSSTDSSYSSSDSESNSGESTDVGEANDSVKPSVKCEKKEIERFGRCPVCDKTVPLSLMNLHLDTDCKLQSVVSERTSTSSAEKEKGKCATTEPTTVDLTTAACSKRMAQQLLSPLKLKVSKMPLMKSPKSKAKAKGNDADDKCENNDDDIEIVSVNKVLMASAKSSSAKSIRFSIPKIETPQKSSKSLLKCTPETSSSGRKKKRAAVIAKSSPLVQCPICAKPMVEWQMGVHLDSGECRKRQRIQARGRRKGDPILRDLWSPAASRLQVAGASQQLSTKATVELSDTQSVASASQKSKRSLAESRSTDSASCAKAGGSGLRDDVTID